MKPTIEIDNRETVIKSVITYHTGGHIYNDVITLKDGTVIRISDGAVVVFKNEADDDENNEIGHIYF
jgi:hypothetical protein